MRIEEICDILGYCWGLRVPEYILITDEDITAQNDGVTHYRGLQPKDRRGIIILGKYGNIASVPHESWHAITGLGELTANPVGEMFARHYARRKKVMEKFPSLNSIFRRNVKYREIDFLKEFPNVAKYRGRVKLYKRV